VESGISFFAEGWSDMAVSEALLTLLLPPYLGIPGEKLCYLDVNTESVVIACSQLRVQPE
jgi:hypothetical protein